MGALPLWRKKAIDLLMNQDGKVTARDLLAFFFSNNREAFNYFAFRFGQPRHLVALSFASIIRQPSKPILDLACGFGHITRSLTLRVGGQPVFGSDESFRGLYLAKHWIAPDATYVCCSADAGLPFADGSFEAVFCSDAFHYFISKKPVVQELKRLTRQSGLIILSWVHNAQFRMPHDGLPLPPQGYQELFADMPSRMVPDDHVLGRYLKKHGPALSQPTDFTLLAKAPLLSIVASPRQNLFQDYGPFTDWPHAEGRLRVNPLFREQQGDRNGGVILRRTYPSAFYEADHAESNNYLPERVELERQIMDDPERFRRTPVIDQLIAQCVVLSMPDGYQ
jgi:SAM-dependent methyltransferase